MLPPSTLRIGGSGAGKTTSTIPELVRLVEERDCAMIVQDKHGMLTRLLMLHLIKRGRTSRVLYDQLSNYDRILAPRFLVPSYAENPLRRQAEVHANLMSFLDILWTASGRDDQDWELMPSLSMYLYLGAKLFVCQPEPLDAQYFPFVFRPDHPVFHYFLNNTFDEEAREAFTKIARLAKNNNENLLDQTIGAARRLTRQDYSETAFAVRMAGTVDIEKVLLEKKIILLDGSDDGSVPDKSVKSIYRMWNEAAFRAQRRYYTRTGEPLNCVYVWEEAAATGNVGPTEIAMLREGRKFGAAPYILSQDLEFIDPTVMKAVMGSTTRHIWDNPGDPDVAMIAARDIVTARLDPYRVHSETETEQAIHDGFATDHRTSVTKVDGETKSETTSPSLVPMFRHVKNKQTKYFSMDDQILEGAKELLQMAPGWSQQRIRGRYVSSKPEYTTPLPDPYPEADYPGAADMKFTREVAKSQESQEFITPVELDTSWATTITPKQGPETNGHGNGSTFIPLPENYSSKPDSTQQRRRRGKGSNGGKMN